MQVSKNYIIYGLIIIICFLFLFVILDKPDIKIITKEKNRIVYKDKIIYKNRKIEKIPINKKETTTTHILMTKSELDLLPEIDITTTHNNRYIVSKIRDSKGRFSIELLSKQKPTKKDIYKRKIILHTKIEKEDYVGKFLFLVPPALVDNIENLSIKITDAITGDIFEDTAYCIASIESAFQYSMNISLDNGFNCYVSEKGKAIKINKQSEESLKEMKDRFMKSRQNNLK